MDLLGKYKIDIDDIESVGIDLDDDVPEYMAGILRIGRVILYTRNQEYDIQELVDNTEFDSEKEVEEFVNQKLGITFSQVIE